ncbi:hypothetical protein GCM10010954_30520 [Halobacillus andaensis]|uniref:Uncharacterized protein n=1 Tax=Halobacillus andaensis TaxID=1176239 RepID=A0A917EY26_HALAA|nr:hypothetical protein GCM10010954_30520 [Halobacillus andaensis]
MPSEDILKTWRKFDHFPMETVSKLWVYNKHKAGRQRDIAQMREDRQKYGLSGNCFDLAIWLLDEFKKDGIKAYPIGHDIDAEGAHVAVIAVDETGGRYLCDLGDQWITPILIDSHRQDFSEEKLSGVFPAAKIQVKPGREHLEILYHRPNGKVSKQTYDTTPIEAEEFRTAAEASQNRISPPPLIECRVGYKDETAHWEFDDWEITWSTTEGLIKKESNETMSELADVIETTTGMDKGIVQTVLELYRKREKE